MLGTNYLKNGTRCDTLGNYRTLLLSTHVHKTLCFSFVANSNGRCFFIHPLYKYTIVDPNKDENNRIREKFEIESVYLATPFVSYFFVKYSNQPIALPIGYFEFQITRY